MITRPGIALVITILLLAVIAAAGAGIFALGVRETEIARAMVRRSATGTAAESAVRAAVHGWSTSYYRSLGTGQSVPARMLDDAGGGADGGPGGATGSAGAGLESSVLVTRLDDRLFLVAGTTQSVVGPRAVARAAVLVRTLDPDAIARAFPAAVTAEDAVVVEAGRVSGRIPPGDGSDAPACGEPLPAPAILAPEITIDPGAAVGDADAVIGLAPAMPDFDPFLPPFLAHVVTETVPGGAMTPGPWSGVDGCEARPSNWGAVSPTHECHDRLPLVHSDGDITLRGGEARGFLLVDGDLHIDGGRLDGIVLVRGRVTVTGAATLRGALRARSVRVVDGTLMYEPCARHAALAAGGLDRAFRPSDRWWIPVF